MLTMDSNILKDYTKFVREHWPGHGLTCAILGLTGEAGEVADVLKKDRYHKVPTTLGNYVDELGDVLFYVVAVAEELSISIKDVIAANVAKISRRYPGGFVPGGGIRE
jgi:NTP pyrophosphatase (non-canonical NTP hydrolase)